MSPCHHDSALLDSALQILIRGRNDIVCSPAWPSEDSSTHLVPVLLDKPLQLQQFHEASLVHLLDLFRKAGSSVDEIVQAGFLCHQRLESNFLLFCNLCMQSRTSFFSELHHLVEYHIHLHV